MRKGAISIDTGRGEIVSRAGQDLAGRVRIDQQRRVSTASASTSGADWEWIYAVTPPHRIEGESVYAFLRWSSGESGLQLRFSDARSEYYARATRLHGSLPELDPDRAVELVLATTDRVTERADGVLRISLRTDPDSE